ncbi:MAG: DeoR/GlpR family DNA-binding transcription regulator [Armatimonadota bacterium]
MGNNELFVPERWDKIRAVLEQKGRATVEELAGLFGVSRSTIRRDLLEMHQRNILVRTRGGAVKSQMVAFDRPVTESGALDVELKEKIGRAAAQLISPGETVMADAGSTVYQVVKHLQAANVTLVTNSFNSALVAMSKPDMDLIMIGGLARVHAGATVGPSAEDQIAMLKADTAVLGINGISLKDGLTTPNLLVAQVKREMINHSNRLIIVADHTKLGVSALCKVAPLDAVEILVTDDKADPEMVAGIRSLGVEVILAE